MEFQEAQERAAQILRIIAGFDRRETDHFEVRAWASAVMREPDALANDWVEAIQEHYLQPQARRAMPGDILATVTKMRQDRDGVRAIPKADGKGVPCPADFWDRVELSELVVKRFKQSGINPSLEEVTREFRRYWPEFAKQKVQSRLADGTTNTPERLDQEPRTA
ncbi:hypothetical protein QP868_02145 [Brevibacterium sp. UMB1308A]|uniref:hypothetical protein n=1 Tax=Brevibacterium sp. UMB1308A TaxID=3050608 RepID=UPI00254DB28D|nr:hypothetical protein [Brevibacterium sp. UMB1308A]MDK8345455.1 hypothetical protein [Brevibacterium sp. UMB1308B]MDK8712699.1 hypothetical protein [Brevibacterium sp. UMB1308A]